MRKLKIVQIGVEHDHASQIFATMKKRPDLFEIAGYFQPEDDDVSNCSPLHKPYEGAKRFETLEEALSVPGLDAVTIETSELNLTKYATICAKRGLPMHMDKPGGLSSDEYDALLALVKEKNIAFSTGYMYRYNPAVKKLMEIVESGKLGKITSVETHMDCIESDTKRAWLSRLPGGMMFFLGCHLLDMVVRIMGRFPDDVIPMNHATGFRDIQTDDVGYAILKYGNEVSFCKTSGTEIGGFMRRQTVVSGANGTVVIEPMEYSGPGGQYTDMRVVLTENDGLNWGSKGEKTTFGPADRYEEMLETFVKAVCGEAELPVTLEYESDLHRLLMAASGYEDYPTYLKGKIV